MQKIAASIADFTMRDRNPSPSLETIAGAALCAGKSPLVASQVARFALQVLGIGDTVAVARDEEVLHTEIHTDGATGGR